MPNLPLVGKEQRRTGYTMPGDRSPLPVQWLGLFSPSCVVASSSPPLFLAPPLLWAKLPAASWKAARSSTTRIAWSSWEISALPVGRHAPMRACAEDTPGGNTAGRCNGGERGTLRGLPSPSRRDAPDKCQPYISGRAHMPVGNHTLFPRDRDSSSCRTTPCFCMRPLTTRADLIAISYYINETMPAITNATIKG